MVIEPGNGINSSNSAAGKTRQSTARSGAETSDASSPAANKHSADSVSLSNKGQSLNRVEAAIANVPDIDSQKVAAIKSSIEDGSYKINASAIAGKLLAQDELL